MKETELFNKEQTLLEENHRLIVIVNKLQQIILHHLNKNGKNIPSPAVRRFSLLNSLAIDQYQSIANQLICGDGGII